MTIALTRTLFKWHRWTGVVCAVFLLFISFTGAVAVFKDEIDWVTTPARRLRDARGAPRPLGETIAAARRHVPGAEATSVHLPQRPDEAAVVQIRSKETSGQVYVDPYIGRVTGTRMGESLTNVIRQTHVRFFFFGRWGRVADGVFGLMLVVSTITGVLIYWPFMRGVFRHGLRWWQIRGQTRQVAWSDLHKLVGIVGLAFNFAIAVTGAVLGLEVLTTYAPAVDRAIHPRPERIAGPWDPSSAVPADEAFEAARRAFPDLRPLTISLPSK